MKVSEAIDLLKRYPKDCEIYLCKDWEQLDDNGNLTNLHRLRITCDTHMEEFHKGCEIEVVDKVIILCDANEEPTIID